MRRVIVAAVMVAVLAGCVTTPQSESSLGDELYFEYYVDEFAENTFAELYAWEPNKQIIRVRRAVHSSGQGGWYVIYQEILDTWAFYDTLHWLIDGETGYKEEVYTDRTVRDGGDVSEFVTFELTKEEMVALSNADSVQISVRGSKGRKDINASFLSEMAVGVLEMNDYLEAGEPIPESVRSRYSER